MTKFYKSFLALMLAMLCCGAVHAQTHMTFYEPSGGVLAAWSLQDVTKVAFNGDNIVVKGALGIDTFSFGQVMSIKFTDEPEIPSGLKTVRDDASQLRIAVSESAIRVMGATSGTVSIWSPNGQQLYSNRHWRGEEISTAQLEHGIYIITINNSTFKFKK